MENLKAQYKPELYNRIKNNALNYAIYNCNPKELPEAKMKRDQLVLAEVLA